MSGRNRGLAFQPGSQQRLLHHVESAVLPRLPVGLQIGTQEVVVEKGPGTLVGQVRADDRLEKAGVFPLQEQIHLVAGELRIPGPLLLRVQGGPAHQPVEAGQRRIGIQGPQQSEDRFQRLIGLPPAVPEIAERQRLAPDQSPGFPDFGGPSRGVQRTGQTQILADDGRGGPRQGLPGGLGLVFDLDLDHRTVSERRGRQADPALGIGHQVEPGQRSPGQEVQFGARRRRRRGLFLARQALGHLDAAGHVAHRRWRRMAVGDGEGHRVGRTFVPGVEEQSRASQPVARILPGIPAVEDVARLVADGPPARVEVGQMVGDLVSGSPPGEPAEAGEQRRLGHEVAGDHMDTGGSVPVEEPDLGLARGGEGHRGEVHRRSRPQLQRAGLAHQPTGHGNPVGDAQGGQRFTGVAQSQRIVAGGQPGDLQLVAHGADGRAPVGDERAPAQLQQGPGVGCVPREPWDPHGFPDTGMDLAGAGPVGGLQRPGTVEVLPGRHLDPREVLEPAEFDAPLRVGPQRRLLGGHEPPPVEHESQRLIGHGFAVAAEDLDPMVLPVPSQEGVPRSGGPFQAVDLPGAGRAQFALLAAGHRVDPPAQGGRDPSQTVGDAEGPREQSRRLEVRGAEFDRGRAGDAVMGDRGECQSRFRQQFGRGRVVADAQR